MEPTPAPTDRPFLSGLTREALAALLEGWGEKPFRADQVYRAVHGEARLDAATMTTLPKALRERLATETTLPATTILESETSRDDGTQKLLLGLVDGKRIETVLIPEGKRRTVCVSTQVGCPIGCVFCASGVGGLVRNLAAAEIVEQPYHVQALTGERPTHLVVMGMGEPLLNLENLRVAVAHWRDERTWGISPRRITVSTASTPKLIEDLLRADLGVNLAVSLHAPDDETRRALVPTSRPGRVRELVEAAGRYARVSKRDATVEYVLIRGENDAPRDAETLARLLRGRHIHVNLIPLNPTAHRPDLRPPAGAAAVLFRDTLVREGVSATLRTRRGDDIHAACGQLALERALGPDAEA